MTKAFSKQVRFKEGDGMIHGFTTGTVQVKSKFRTARGNVFTSKINFLFDDEFTEPMPVMVWVVDHPEGIFVVDTGENAEVNNDDYFKDENFLLRYINKKSWKFHVEPDDEVGPQLKQLGYSEKDIKSVILTHLHIDHFDGLKYFENTTILVNQLEWEKSSSALPSLYPDWFSPDQIKLKESKSNGFKNTSALVESGEIELVHTPGHTLGHCSVLVKTSQMHYLLAGDVTYNQRQLENNINAGGHQSFKLAEDTYQSVKSYGAKNKMVYLPSHDNLGLDRLEKDQFLKV